MILDGQLQFSDAQAVTATAGSTNQVDLGPTYQDQNVDLGTGEELYVVASLASALVGAGATVTVTVQTDSDSAFGSPTTVQTIGTFAALSAAGTKLQAKLQPGLLEKYIRLVYTVAGGTLTGGSIDAHLVKNIDSYRNYKNAYIVS